MNPPPSVPVSTPDLRAIALALRERPELPLLLTPETSGTAQAIALGELLVAAEELGAFADFSPHGAIAFAAQEHPDGLRFFAEWTPTGQYRRTGDPVPLRDLVPPARPGNADDDVERTMWVLIRVRRAFGAHGALPAAVPQDLGSTVAHLTAFLYSCRDAGIDPLSATAAAWNRYDPQHDPFTVDLPSEPLSLLRAILDVLEREPDVSDQVGQIFDLFESAGWTVRLPEDAEASQAKTDADDPPELGSASAEEQTRSDAAPLDSSPGREGAGAGARWFTVVGSWFEPEYRDADDTDDFPGGWVETVEAASEREARVKALGAQKRAHPVAVGLKSADSPEGGYGTEPYAIATFAGQHREL